MTTAAIAGIGTLLQIGNGATPTEIFTTIAEVNNITNTKTREVYDVTSFESVGGYREKIPGLRDPGEYNFNMFFTAVNYGQLNDEFESNTLRNFRLVMPDDGASQFDFSGYITSIGKAIPLTNMINCDVVIAVSGQEIVTS